LDPGHAAKPQGTGKTRLPLGGIIGKEVALYGISSIYHVYPCVVQWIAFSCVGRRQVIDACPRAEEKKEQGNVLYRIQGPPRMKVNQRRQNRFFSARLMACFEKDHRHSEGWGQNPE
jgi:hypothetical protein